MTEKTKRVLAVYLSGLLQGISLILFPAAGPVLTSPDFHGLTSSQFGVLFTPQIVGAIAASTLAARFAARVGMKRVLLGGLLANLLAMLLLAITQLALAAHGLALILLLLATGAVGAGFGLAITALNAYAFDLFPTRADAAVTGLHVLTGLGQVGAPLVLALFLGLGFWWAAPLTVGVLLMLMVGFQRGLPMELGSRNRAATGKVARTPLPGRIWLYAVVVFLYGISEATFGNWSAIHLEQDAGLTTGEAGMALAVFWGMVTAGRVLFTLAALRLEPGIMYVVSPFAVGIAFLAVPSLAGPLPSLLGLGLAGLALSFFFPFSVSLASGEKPELAPAISGTLVAAIMLGTGFSANVVGFAREALGLSLIFRLSSLYALLMGALALYLTLTRKRGPMTEEDP